MEIVLSSPIIFSSTFLIIHSYVTFYTSFVSQKDEHDIILIEADNIEKPKRDIISFISLD